MLIVVMSNSVYAGYASVGGRYDGYRYNGYFELTSQEASAELSIVGIAGEQLLPEENYAPKVSGIICDTSDTVIVTISKSGCPTCSWSESMIGEDPAYGYCYFYLNTVSVGNKTLTVN